MKVRWLSTKKNINLREVDPGLFVGAFDAPTAVPWKWGLVVDMTGRTTNANAEKLLSLPMPDGTEFGPGVLDKVAEAIKRTDNKPVLIHCHAGLSRSTSVAYAMLRKFRGLDHAEALRRVKVHPYFPMERTLLSARLWVTRNAT